MSGINYTWVRHCHVIKNCATTDHEASLDFSSLGRQNNHPFQLRFEDADWLNFMSHLEYIYILNQDLTKFYKDPPPVDDFSIPSAEIETCWQAERSYCDGENYFHRRFLIISHHTNVYLYDVIYITSYKYNYYFVCVVQGGRRPSPLLASRHWHLWNWPDQHICVCAEELQGFLAYLLQQVLAADVHLHSHLRFREWRHLQSFLFCSIYNFFLCLNLSKFYNSSQVVKTRKRN